MSQLEKLIRKRGAVKARLTRFETYLSELESSYPNKNITEQRVLLVLEERIDRAKNLLQEYENIQLEIDEISDNPEEEFREQKAFEAIFYTCIAMAKEFKLPPGNIKSSNSGDDIAHDFAQNIKLPVIQLPTFDGNYENWLEYRDTFDSLIHKNVAISNVQKFHYLRASLKGSALQIIASLEFSNSNYAVAWDLVCNRFNNTRILKQNHVKALFNLEKIFDESSTVFRTIIDKVTKHLRSLKLLGEPTEGWDTLIIHLICTKLDSVTSREWEQKRAVYENPSLNNLKEFLKDRADLLEALEHDKANKRFSRAKQDIRTKTFVTAKEHCAFCKRDHYIQNCSNFTKLNISDRIKQTKHMRLCINCLRPGHIVKECRSSSCKKCKARHNTLLHIETTPVAQSVDQVEVNIDQQESINLASRNISNNSQVLLSTVLINIFDRENTPHKARALLDPGSQSSFITSELCNTLKLPHIRADIKVFGLNQTRSEIKHRVLAQIQSRCNSFSAQVACLVVPQITNDLPNFKIDVNTLQIPGNIKMADPNFHSPNKVDILLGADIFWQIMCVGQIKLPRGPILQKTKFGWIIAGPLNSVACASIQCNFSKNAELDNQLTRFWEIEELPMKKLLSQEEKSCESYFLETVQRDKYGRFIVKIPMKDSPTKLGDSYQRAKSRLLSLERKFKNNSEFKNQYCKFIDEYRNLGHMFKVPENDIAKITYYLPHHGVIKQSSLTTKLRVVFDASCPTTTGVSLNDLQMVGPVIQSDLFSLLLRYRKYNYVIAADIEKMYRMCLVDRSQTPLQRILWRDSPEKPIEIYELATVTYGTASAAYLAIRCLFQLGVECSARNNLIAEVIKNHFYVDDLLTGGDTVEEATFIANEVSSVLENGGFTLRKWVSNSKEVLQGILPKENADSIDFGCNENTKTLGVIWNGQTDSFMYKINQNCTKQITKRSILSEISQIFDPLGLLSPSIITAKIILQELWSEKISWDESLPSHLHTKWLQYRDELSCLNDVKIPRQVVCKNIKILEIHGFSDASTQAFGACIYIKTENQNGEKFVRLLCAKSKVAPLKTQTVPRLELMAALLLAKLGDKVKVALNAKIDKITYWCDSTIVLGWLKISPNQLQTFVANRVANIQELSSNIEWRHVPTADNPADYVSRGVRPNILQSLSAYWQGPSWLQESELSWPTLNASSDSLPEVKGTVHLYEAIVESPAITLENYSDLTRLERVIAYCKRFLSNCRKSKSERNLGSLTLPEIRSASLLLVILSQRESFSRELDELKTNKLANLKSSVVKLQAFLDKDNVIRVGGRLANSNFSFNKKHPILLSSKNQFTKLLFIREHKRLLHAGPQLLLASIRENFWPIAGRNLARRVVYECVTCFKTKPRAVIPIMGNLPAQRVNPAPPFYTTGVDYAGPFLIKARDGRGCKAIKCYIGLFICFLTKAIHLELVTDLTKESFLAAFRRFVGRRGRPAQMFSDNGTNFVGGNSELQRLGKFLQDNAKDIKNSIESEGISWSFIPPQSPHFGGLWEAGVKSTKYHLQRVAGNARLTFEQFYTLLVQIEAILNSRPMSPLSSDPSDLSPLTPAHFLIGRTLTSLPDPDVTHINENRLSHFQRIQQLQQHFWKRWSLEYIAELQQRKRWNNSSGALKLNDLAIIKEDNQPPLRWMLGRIIALHPGADGVARVATVRTSTGAMKRSFTKICPLPVQ